MKNTSPRVDAYIARSPAYARPILKKIRTLFHQASPQMQETIKWGFPHFEYKGIVGSMAAFKRYVTFGFWKGKLLNDPHGLFTVMGKTAMSHTKFTTLAELPRDEVVLDYIREAIRLNEDDVKVAAPKKKRVARPELEVPLFLAQALKVNKRALATFEAFSPSHRREYIEWLIEARKDETRARRLAITMELLTAGKPRNWQYLKRWKRPSAR
jgi:uncharacterized protein YdeI (YjbR/CyaY-like superfamily)